MKFFASVARRHSSKTVQPGGRTSREGSSPRGDNHPSSSTLQAFSDSAPPTPTAHLPPPLQPEEDLPLEEQVQVPVVVPPCCRSTSSTLTSTSPPRQFDHPVKTVTFELDYSENEDEDEDHTRHRPLPFGPLPDSPLMDPRSDGQVNDNDNVHEVEDEIDPVDHVNDHVNDHNAKRSSDDEPLCGTTVTFFEVDHADGDVLYIPRRPEDELLPVTKLVVRTILENRYAKLNRTTLYDTVQKYAQAKVEIQNLKQQVRELQALLVDHRARDEDGGAARSCVRLSRRSQRTKQASEDTLRERLRLFWTKRAECGTTTTNSLEATALAGRYSAPASDKSLLPVALPPLSSSPPLSRLDALRNRRSYLESLTQDLLSVEISTAAAATSKGAASKSNRRTTGAVGSSKDESLSTCSSSGSEPETDGPALAVQGELVVHRIVGTRLEV